MDSGLPEWVTQAGIGVIILWIVVDRLIPKILDFAKGEKPHDYVPKLGPMDIHKNRIMLEQHERDISRIEAKLDGQATLLTEMNGNIIAVQTLLSEMRRT